MPKRKWSSPRFHAVTCTWSLALSLLVLGMGVSCGSSSKKKTINLDDTPSPPQAGQAFYYQHIGARPWSGGEMDCSGGRLVIVMEKDERSGDLWPIEEHYEKAPGVQTGYFDDQFQLHRQRLRSGESELSVRYSPPLTVRYLDILRDGEKEYSSTQTITDPTNGAALGTSRLTVKTKRKYNKRIVTPAGAFLCRHLVSEIRIESNGSGTVSVFQGTVESYWCDRIGWFVQENYSFEPVIQGGETVQVGYQSQSVLTRFKPDNYTPPHPQ